MQNEWKYDGERLKITTLKYQLEVRTSVQISEHMSPDRLNTEVIVFERQVQAYKLNLTYTLPLPLSGIVCLSTSFEAIITNRWCILWILWMDQTIPLCNKRCHCILVSTHQTIWKRSLCTDCWWANANAITLSNAFYRWNSIELLLCFDETM